MTVGLFRICFAVSCFVFITGDFGAAYAGRSVPGSFTNVVYVSNPDGDTITFNIPGAPSIIGQEVLIRLRGIDTPELRKGKCEAERNKALEAQKRVNALLRNAGRINLHRSGRGKYFRILADVEFDGRDLATLLLDEKLGVPYSGGARNHDWCRESVSPSISRQYGRGVLPPKVNGVYVWPPPPGGGR